MGGTVAILSVVVVVLIRIQKCIVEVVYLWYGKRKRSDCGRHEGHILDRWFCFVFVFVVVVVVKGLHFVFNVSDSVFDRDGCCCCCCCCRF